MGFFDTLKNGIFGGGKTGPIFYPNNSLIKDYGMNNAPVFAIDIAAYKAPEQKITKNGSDYAVLPQSNPTPMAEYNIIYSAENITINHSHQFGNNGFWGNLANKTVNEPIMGLGITGKDIINGLAAIQQLRGTAGSTSFKTEWNSFGSLDMSKSYTSSTPPSITLQFNLVTHNDPLLDVILPATVLSYMTYPKAGTDKDVMSIIKALGARGGITDMATSYLSNMVGMGSMIGGAKDKEAAEIAAKAKGVLDKGVDLAQNIYAGKWRYIVGDAPPMWTVLTSNNIFGLYNASVTNMSVTYNGPWLKSPSAGKNVLSGLAGSSAGFNPSSVFPSASGGFKASDLFGMLGGKETGGYPSSASVSMTFESNYSQFFGEELLSFLTNESGIKGGVLGQLGQAILK